MGGYQIVVCGSIVPDPLQTLEPGTGPGGPASKTPGSKVWLVSLGPKAKLQQVMMAVGQKVPFELVAVDGPAGGFLDGHETAAALADAVKAIPGIDRARLLVFGGW